MSSDCRLWPGVLALLIWAGLSPAQTVYRHVDDKGRVTYTDRPPEDRSGQQKVESRRYRIDSSPIANLRFQAEGSKQVVWVRNLLPGPIEVELRLADTTGVVSHPALPLRAELPPLSEQRAATFSVAAGSARSVSLQVLMRALPGSPAGQHSNPIYLFPVRGNAWQLGQGFNGAFSHQDPESRYAIDIGVDEGTPVLAARDGIVIQVEDNFEGNGLNRERFAARGNAVRILHDDGSMAIYGHLSVDSVVVRPGSKVSAGQVLGASGNTGFSTGPHLHFAIQLNRGMQLESIPFRMHGLTLADSK